MTVSPPRALADITAVTQRFWGYDALRPLQEQAIQAGLANRDSLVVMPTGGGKSLCYQVPPILSDRCDIVVSPLIALMKDQVDGLRANGYPAVAIHSNLSPDERRVAERACIEGNLKLIFVAPERLNTSWFMSLIERANIGAFAIDEAHCISHWGHDFRPEYRRLAQLRQRFPHVSIHAFTATATPRVQHDIIAQLSLQDPEILVGTFDRPNLVYRVQSKVDDARQIVEALRRHPNEAAIVYCLSRNDTEVMAATLRQNNINAAHYHAGMDAVHRTKTQEAFAAEKIDVVCATVAFGMGIDRSNVRCVIHASVPKSIEHYQQETGRAGRDSLEAECVLLYSYRDIAVWKDLIVKSATNSNGNGNGGADMPDPGPIIEAQHELLDQVASFAGSAECRHRALSRYFGQRYENDNCGACDVCLGEINLLADAQIVAQKIISCVARLDQRWGAKRVVDVLRGSQAQDVLRAGHDKLSTYALLRELDDKTITNLLYQLIDQGYLARTPGDRPIVTLTEDSLPVLRSERIVRLIDPRGTAVTESVGERDAWDDVDRDLFDALRALRRKLAEERGVPPFVIFGDEVLRELARVRPTTITGFGAIKGVGQRKREDFGQAFIQAIEQHCIEHALETDRVEIAAFTRAPKMSKANPRKEQAMDLFDAGMTIEDVAQRIGRAISTIQGYLVEYVEQRKPQSIDMWINPDVQQRVVETAMSLQSDGRLGPIRAALGETVSYEDIRITLAHLRVIGGMRRLRREAQEQM